jgi:hypothetical protein
MSRNGQLYQIENPEKVKKFNSCRCKESDISIAAYKQENNSSVTSCDKARKGGRIY